MQKLAPSSPVSTTANAVMLCGALSCVAMGSASAIVTPRGMSARARSESQNDFVIYVNN